MNQNQPEKKKHRTRYIILVVVLGMMLACWGLVCWWALFSPPAEPVSVSATPTLGRGDALDPRDIVSTAVAGTLTAVAVARSEPSMTPEPTDTPTEVPTALATHTAKLTPLPTATPSATPTLRVLALDSLRYVVLQFGLHSVVKASSMTIEPTGVFARVDLGVLNVGKDPVFVLMTHGFCLRDSKGRTFAIDDFNTGLLNGAEYGPSSLLLSELNPGLSKVTSLLFDIPADAEVTEFGVGGFLSGLLSGDACAVWVPLR